MKTGLLVAGWMLVCHTPAWAFERAAVLDVAVADSLVVLGQGSKILAIAADASEVLPVLQRKTVVQLGSQWDYAKLRQIKPDVIYTTSQEPQQLQALQQLAPTKVWKVSNAQFWSDAKAANLALAEAVGQPNLGQKKWAALERKRETVRSKLIAQGETILVLEHEQGHYRWHPDAAYQGLLVNALRASLPANMPTATQEVTRVQLQQWQPQQIWVIDKSAASEPFDRTVLEAAAAGSEAVHKRYIYKLSAAKWLQKAGGLNSLNAQLDELLQYAQ